MKNQMQQSISDVDFGKLFGKVESIESTVKRLEARQENEFASKELVELKIKLKTDPILQDVKKLNTIVYAVVSMVCLTVLGAVLYNLGLKK